MSDTPVKKSSPAGAMAASFGVSLVVSVGVTAGALSGMVSPSVDDAAQSARAVAAQLGTLQQKAGEQAKALSELKAEVDKRAEALSSLEAAAKAAAEARAAAEVAAKAEAEARAKDVYGKQPMRGPWNAPVTVVMYGDFQEPKMKDVQPVLKALMEKYGAKLRVVFKNQPLPNHAQAKLAAQAGLAAHAQGKFWEFHDAVVANPGKLDRASLDAHAKEAGLDGARFAAALDGKVHEAEVTAEAAEALKAGAFPVPAFFVGSQKLAGAPSVEAFSKLVDDALSKTAAKPVP